MTEEYVKLSIENYELYKKAYDNYIEDYEKRVDNLNEEIEKLEAGLCIVNVDKHNHYNTLTSDHRPTEVCVLNNESEFYDFVKTYFKTNSQLTEDKAGLMLHISNFQNSKIGKFLSFFGVNI